MSLAPIPKTISAGIIEKLFAVALTILAITYNGNAVRNVRVPEDR